ncbi:MAG: isoprenylcysteine carboxylmethyltransferase family protein [Thermodesulfobacteriota bacterium]
MILQAVEKFRDFSDLAAFRRFLSRTRFILGGGFFALLLYHAHPGPGLFWLASSVSITGELIQVWAASSLEKNTVFHPRGPYVLVRNPMYFGRFFVIGGLLLLDPHQWLLSLYGIVYFGYIQVRVGGEEDRLRSIFGKPYLEYLERVPRFLPACLNPYRGYEDLVFFRWQLVIKNREHRNLLGLVAFYALVHWRL